MWGFLIFPLLFSVQAISEDSLNEENDIMIDLSKESPFVDRKPAFPVEQEDLQVEESN